jgi:aspartyl-tRNA(Asn)/glutamyl-tRNA(Gln) amidotransferase subunit C
VAVSDDDVRHIAALARLGLDPGRIASLAGELNGILAHMEELGAVALPPDVGDDGHDATASQSLPSLRSDAGPQLRLDREREAFAPDMRDGFFLVPRLETHEGEGERAP